MPVGGGGARGTIFRTWKSRKEPTTRSNLGTDVGGSQVERFTSTRSNWSIFSKDSRLTPLQVDLGGKNLNIWTQKSSPEKEREGGRERGRQTERARRERQKESLVDLTVPLTVDCDHTVFCPKLHVDWVLIMDRGRLVESRQAESRLAVTHFLKRIRR